MSHRSGLKRGTVIVASTFANLLHWLLSYGFASMIAGLAYSGLPLALDKLGYSSAANLTFPHLFFFLGKVFTDLLPWPLNTTFELFPFPFLLAYYLFILGLIPAILISGILKLCGYRPSMSLLTWLGVTVGFAVGFGWCIFMLGPSGSLNYAAWSSILGLCLSGAIFGFFFGLFRRFLYFRIPRRNSFDQMD